MSADEKLWIDDTREAPEGWTWIKTFDEARKRLREPCAEVSFDNNLGYSPEWSGWRTGLELLEMFAGKLESNGTKVYAHTSNKEHRNRMYDIINMCDLQTGEPPVNVPLTDY